MATQSQQKNERSEKGQGQGQQGQGQQGQGGRQMSQGGDENAMLPFDDMYKYFQEYARERPEVVALWCFGIGFVLGWKLKPW